jgi:chromosome segregation ATPase
MVMITGMEKFSHLEDKIFLTVQMVRKLRDERDSLEKEADSLRLEIAALRAEKTKQQEKLEAFAAERGKIKSRVEHMLESITVIEPETAALLGK